MRPVLPERKMNYKMLAIYICIGIVCVIGIGISVYMQYFQDENIGVIFGITDSEEEDRYNELKNNFNSLFTNDLTNMQEGSINVEKIREDYDIVVTRYSYNEQEENYTLNVSIPNININNEKINEYNNELVDKYTQEVEEIKLEIGYVYDVKYKAYIQDNILSLVIYSELKEQDNNQRIMIDTFNYDLINNKEVTLGDLLELKNITVSNAQNRIDSEIEQVQQRNSSLKELGYNIYERDLPSDMYEISNIENYFLGEDGNIYIVFAYGNYEQTNEMDLIIFT